MNPSHPAPSGDESTRRRQRLLNDFFRNAVALALMKQALVAGANYAHSSPEDGEPCGVPPYLQG